MVAAAIAVAVSGLAIFVVPGAAVLVAASAPLPRNQLAGYAFAASLALLAASFAACLALETSIAAAPLALAVVTIVAVVAARICLPRARATDLPASAEEPGTSRAPFLVAAALTAAAVVAAVLFAPVGSVDRWWYLAYVRGWLDAPVLTLAEPFLGTGQVFARFGVHPWLFGLATWSHLSGVDPVLLYERGAPVIVVLASVSATHALACELFGPGLRARLTIIAGILLWSGAMIPVFARAGEDKVLAAAALLPLGIAAFLRVVQNARPAAHPEQTRARGTVNLLLLSIVAVATAGVHALAYAFLLVTLLPVAALVARRDPTRRRILMASTAVLLLVAVAPAITGLVVRERLRDTGAELSVRDHPVVRVHEGRDRLIELGMLGYVVNPRLLLHPLALFALAGIPLLRRLPHDPRGPLRREAASLLSEPGPIGHRDLTVLFLATTTMVSMAIAFVPPLPALAGAIIPPWMVYRVLWLLPLAPLAAITAEALSSSFAAREAAAVLLLVFLGVPVLADGARARLAEVRARLATPAADEFREMTKAVAQLPPDSLLVAAPELSERLPAFTSRRVVAALDRSTIVFSGSRDQGEARLRARIAILSGDTEGAELARIAGVRPTHAVFDPGSDALPRCGRELFRSRSYALCELAPEIHPAGRNPELPASGELPLLIVAEGLCRGLPAGSRRDPWSAAAPVADCRIDVPRALQGREDLFLRIDAVTGRAADELRITTRTAGTPRREYRTTVRLTVGAAIALRLPQLATDTLEVRISSSFLPVVRITRVAIATH